MPELILASASPRRRELLGRLGVDFLVRPSNVNEDPLPGESPLETQHRITREKARSVAAISPIPRTESAGQNPEPHIANVTTIACDTTVLLDGEMLNKPRDVDEARQMLRKLRGRTHEVQSALVIWRGDAEVIDVVTTLVVMRDYGDDEIEAYIASGDPFDKAGSYAVQHETFRPVHEIRGCPLNVIGLSLCHVCAHLPELPDCAPVCAAYFEKPCPSELDDPEHVVSGQMQF